MTVWSSGWLDSAGPASQQIFFTICVAIPLCMLAGMYACDMVTVKILDLESLWVKYVGTSLESTGQGHIPRSSGQDQGLRSKRVVVCPCRAMNFKCLVHWYIFIRSRFLGHGNTLDPSCTLYRLELSWGLQQRTAVTHTHCEQQT